MKLAHVIGVAALAGLFCCAQTALADDIVTASLGTPSFASGSDQTPAAVVTALAGEPAPFNVICGSDATTNCSISWTLNYTVPAGDSITAATLAIGIYDLDSAAPGNQIASFTLDGTDDLTAALNAVSEGINAANDEYDILNLSITDAAGLADLQSGSATFSLLLTGPGLGGKAGSTTTTTPFNSAALDSSSLLMTGTPSNNNGGGGTNPVPEPSSLMLLGTGLVGLISLKRPFRK